MQTSVFELKSLRTLGIFLACGALIAGCAGNHVEPADNVSSSVDTSQSTTVQPDKQVASENPLPSSNSNPQVSDQENSSPVSNTVATPPAKTTETSTVADASNSEVSSTPATIQEPTQKTFYFGLNQSKLKPQDDAIIAQHALFLKANPTLLLEINGHTDSTGPRLYNEHLSKQRAEAVASLLIKDGVKPSQLVIKALADNKPLADTSAPEKNRRVDLQYDDMSMLSSK